MFHQSRRFALLVAALLSLPGSAAAQEAGKKGLTVGYPASIGVIWHLTEKVAVRPDFSFNTSSFESSTSESSTTATTIGVSALFYVKKWDPVSSYVAGRFGWNRSSTESESRLFPESNESTTNIYSFTGSFGAQAAIGQRFAVFGEVGLNYSKNTFDDEFDLIEPNGSSFGLRSGVGIILYF